MAGFVNRERGSSNFSLSSILKKMSSFGMEYGDMVIKQSQAIGVTEDEFGWSYDPTGALGGDYDEYRMFANLSVQDTSIRKNISIFDQQYPKLREELREFAVQDEIEDVLDTVSDESIVYDEMNYFCQPTVFDNELLDDDTLKAIRKSMSENFKRIYQYFGFINEGSAWNFFRKWLVDGYLAFEIIYDDKQKQIIGFKELDPFSLEPGLNDAGEKMWTQFKGQQNKERSLFDSQVIYISYSHINSPNRVSYVARLVRSFNLLRIMEHTRIIWAVVNASFKTQFIIPVGGKSKTRAKQSLASLMQSYREVIDFDTSDGTIKVNGKSMMPFNKEYWLPSNDAGQPEISTVGGDGPDLSDTEAVKYFREKFYKQTKIPLSRFDMESPPSWEMQAEGATRDEIKFGRFIDRLRSIFQEILTKPLWIQMTLEYPELASDDNFKSQIGIKYNRLNVFEEMKEMEVLEKQINFIQSMKDGLIDVDANMMEVRFFSSEFLVRKYLGLTAEDLALNKRLKDKEQKEMDENSPDEPEM
jgi:hypothetical protein